MKKKTYIKPTMDTVQLNLKNGCMDNIVVGSGVTSKRGLSYNEDAVPATPNDTKETPWQ